MQNQLTFCSGGSVGSLALSMAFGFSEIINERCVQISVQEKTKEGEGKTSNVVSDLFVAPSEVRVCPGTAGLY